MADTDDDVAVCFARAEVHAERAALIGGVRAEAAIHAVYYAMFHAARGALFALEGGASTRHGRVLASFVALVDRLGLPGAAEHGLAFRVARDLRLVADYEPGDADLGEGARELLAGLPGFIAFCRELAGRRGIGQGGADQG
jgi:uncharacterized protein (UPF0332 family)